MASLWSKDMAEMVEKGRSGVLYACKRIRLSLLDSDIKVGLHRSGFVSIGLLVNRSIYCNCSFNNSFYFKLK